MHLEKVLEIISKQIIKLEEELALKEWEIKFLNEELNKEREKNKR